MATSAQTAGANDSEFVSLVSHQLRTPITALSWSMETLLGQTLGPLNDKQQAFLRDMLRRSIELDDTIRLMLMISKVDAGTLPIEPTRIDVSALFGEILEVYKPFADKESLTVSADAAPGLSLVSDAASIKEIVSNFVSNAIRYTPRGGTVRVSARIDGDRVIIDVTDTGYGIPVDQQHKIFSKFFRADNAQKVAPTGTGLGLFLSRLLADRIGARISFVSRLNAGTTFTLDVPRDASLELTK